ncbi:hypothetical protein B0H67DRAFT_665166 [Lasiosphaeris hirsuta]|uniref:Uncharacterized protein n=1 Tax=Lasiosphaeris hirsuta TaxID=260670 RepID=A0AA40AG39_9PEZI|nr:hypothetical protein B0H67DRAFT_665166 [Lasiosphaeris hirsuta]
MGLAPDWAAPGDAIFMLLGGEMLYLARPTLDGTYHYVGEAYVHGIMDGQVVQAFEPGEGTLQRVEFVPVVDQPHENMEPTPSNHPFRFEGTTVEFKKMPLGYNVESHQFSNPEENILGYVHTCGDPRLDKVISQIAPEVTESYVMEGMSPDDAFTKCMMLGEWAKVVESRVLGGGGGTGWKGKSTSLEPAGRDFAKQLYVRSTLTLERGRHVLLWQSHVAKAAALQGRTPVLYSDEAYRTARGYFVGAEDSNRMLQDQKVTNDEKLAQALQEKEWYAPPPRINRETAGSSSLGDFGPQAQSPPPLVGTRAASRSGRPKQLGYLDRGECPPVLFGRGVDDRSMRPKVDIVTYGKPGNLRCEDQYGNEVVGPALDDILNDNSDSDDELMTQVSAGKTAAGQYPSVFQREGGLAASWGNLVRMGEWEGPGEAETPYQFEIFEETDELGALTRAADWEGRREAEVPLEFTLSDDTVAQS